MSAQDISLVNSNTSFYLALTLIPLQKPMHSCLIKGLKALENLWVLHNAMPHHESTVLSFFAMFGNDESRQNFLESFTELIREQ
jgi:hypothetical protein